MQLQILSKLIEKIEKEINNFGYTIASFNLANNKKLNEAENLKIINTQTGTIRTNCLDSLDRTGVVQSVIARNILHKQLNELGLESVKIDNKDVFAPFINLELEQTFRNLWTDNADQLSILYSGTKALKTDFTRTGKRSAIGALWDGKNSLQRYYIGRFSDGYDQDSVELAAGTIDPVNEQLRGRSFIPPGFFIIGIVSLVMI